MHTPWGPSQSQEPLAHGITFVSTSSHGGIKLDRRRQAAMPAALKLPGGWYEEDMEFHRVILAFPADFTEPEVTRAHATMKSWHPDVYEAWSGVPVLISESHVLQERAFLAEHANDWLVIAAYGSWHKNVPEGYVGVRATLGGHWGDGTTEERCFLVPQAEYDARGISFVIEPQRHHRCGPI
jgi:hypothetical protein